MENGPVHRNAKNELIIREDPFAIIDAFCRAKERNLYTAINITNASNFRRNFQKDLE